MLTSVILGYKLRKHIAKALQVRSKAIQSALDKYNAIATAMQPPRRTLKWEEVVEYAFLSDFDLLRDTRQDVSKLPWASPMARRATDLHFKMCRAKEEIRRLNIEIRRLITYIHDEERYLRECENQLKTLHPGLAHQVSQSNVRGRFTLKHLKRLRDIAALPGFSGTLVVGESIRKVQGESSSNASVCLPTRMSRDSSMDATDFSRSIDVTDTQNDLEDEQDAEDLAEDVLRAFDDVLHIAEDSAKSLPLSPEY